MNTSPITLKQTPLHLEHVRLGAKMVGFGGWEMPLQYDGILAEWEFNRKTCSIFDCSHMGEFYIKGDAQVIGLDRILTQSVADMPTKTCRYGVMLNAQGGVIDDLIVYRQAAEEWMIVVNAANIEKDAAHFRANLKAQAQFQDASQQTAKLDLQGPLSREILSAHAKGIEHLAYYTFDQYQIKGIPCLISRTGYTGELGYEIYCPWAAALDVWNLLRQDARVKPTGLGVRDVLRIEMCYSLYGHELTENITPLEAGLSRFLDWSKDFIGKEALCKQKEKGVVQSIAYVKSDLRRSPREGQSVFNADQKRIGTITSGTFSPGLGAGIGIAMIEKSENILEKKIVFGDDKSVCGATLVKRPFYTQSTLKD